MKKIILLAVLAAGSLCMSAQSFSDFFSTEKSTEKITYGVRLGLNIDGMKNNVSNDVVVAAFNNLPYRMDVKRKAGVNLGVNVDFPVLKNLWVNTGLYYTTSGVKLNFKQDFSKTYEGYLPEYTASVTMHNVRIPVQASYRYNITSKYQLQVNLGPYFAYGFSGKAKVKNDVDGSSLGNIDLTGNPKFTNVGSEEVGYATASDLMDRDEFEILGAGAINGNKKDYVSPFDMGIAFGAGVTYNKKYYAGFNYDGGLVNVNGKRMRALIHNSVKNHTFSINIGYNF